MRIAQQKHEVDLTTETKLLSEYTRRSEYYEKVRKKSLKMAHFIFPLIRTIIAFLIICTFVQMFVTKEVFPICLITVLLIIIFIVINFYHSRRIDSFERTTILSRINRDNISRIKREWVKLETPDHSKILEYRSTLFKDLNIIGKNSLFTLLGTIKTDSGLKKFLDWITNNPENEVLKYRQKAIKELSLKLDFRQEIYYLVERLKDTGYDYKFLIEWGKNNSKINYLAYSFSCVMSLITIILGIVSYFNQGCIKFFIIAVLINFITVVSRTKKFSKFLNKISEVEIQLNSYREFIKLILKEKENSSYLSDLINKIKFSGSDIDIELKRLGLVVGCCNVKKLLITNIIFQLLVQFNSHIEFFLYLWKKKYGLHVEKWLNVFTELEVISSIAGLAYDNDNWCFPEINADTDKIITKGVGHPLISYTQRVCNDLDIGPQKTFLLITGSNMSGKSTLLRCIGCNTLLARTGSPVCAEVFKFPKLEVLTSFRLEDSVTEGLSYYMAELKHIKNIIEKINRNTENGVLSLYLLDEILQGTNSYERHVAVNRIINNLLSQKTIGMISTHDLKLAEENKFENCCRTVHFEEEIIVEENQTCMNFDYKLHDGISKTTNGLMLLKAVGIDA